MVAHVNTVAFHGVDVVDVDVQVQMSSGLPAFTIVGLPDKAVAESRERVRAALKAVGLSLPPKRITVNVAPASLAKEGSHYDLPIALGCWSIWTWSPPMILPTTARLVNSASTGRLRPWPACCWLRSTRPLAIVV